MANACRGVCVCVGDDTGCVSVWMMMPTGVHGERVWVVRRDVVGSRHEHDG